MTAASLENDVHVCCMSAKGAISSSRVSASGIAWTLQRAKDATKLRISIHTAPVLSYNLHEREDWATILPEMQAVIKASKDLPKLQTLVCCLAPLLVTSEDC